MHHKNLQKVVVEIYKDVNGLCPEIVYEVFQVQIQNHHKLRNNFTFRISSLNAIFKGKK